MKYNEELFDISKEYTDRVEPILSSKETSELESRVLDVLIKRYKKMLSVEDKKHDGVLKIRLRGEDEGYYELKRLVKLNKFTSFASEYCIYIKKEQEKTSGDYFDLIWDYKTYFDTLSSLKQSDFGYNVNDDIELMTAICEFKKLPITHQLSVIKSFKRKIKKQKLVLEKELIDQVCKKEGHSFSDWEQKMITVTEKNPYLGSRDYIVPQGMECIPRTYPEWRRKCSRCGYEEITREEPLEVREKRVEEERQYQIEKLERELKALRGK